MYGKNETYHYIDDGSKTDNKKKTIYPEIPPACKGSKTTYESLNV
jgi:hypothetical protein